MACHPEPRLGPGRDHGGHPRGAAGPWHRGWVGPHRAVRAGSWTSVKGRIHERASAMGSRLLRGPGLVEPPRAGRRGGPAGGHSRCWTTWAASSRTPLHSSAWARCSWPTGRGLPVVLVLSTLPALVVVLDHSREFHAWWSGTTEERRLGALLRPGPHVAAVGSGDPGAYGLSDSFFRDRYRRAEAEAPRRAVGARAAAVGRTRGGQPDRRSS